MKRYLLFLALVLSARMAIASDVVQPVLVVNCPDGAVTSYSGIAQPVTMSNVCPAGGVTPGASYYAQVSAGAAQTGFINIASGYFGNIEGAGGSGTINTGSALQTSNNMCVNCTLAGNSFEALGASKFDRNYGAGGSGAALTIAPGTVSGSAGSIIGASISYTASHGNTTTALLLEASGGSANHAINITAGDLAFSGTGAPTASQALCIVGGILGHCTTVVGASGGCTCTAP